jgi:hypothetical protein
MSLYNIAIHHFVLPRAVEGCVETEEQICNEHGVEGLLYDVYFVGWHFWEGDVKRGDQSIQQDHAKIMRKSERGTYMATVLFQIKRIL